jgi:hypothetical protein
MNRVRHRANLLSSWAASRTIATLAALTAQASLDKRESERVQRD